MLFDKDMRKKTMSHKSLIIATCIVAQGPYFIKNPAEIERKRKS